MKPTVYIETSIVGYLTTRLAADPIVRAHMLTTRSWWQNSRSNYDVFTSQIVIAEITQGDPTAAAERLAAVTSVALLPVTSAVDDLADLLLARHALPIKARVDATHLGTAAMNGMDYLLTWNCRHLANAALRKKIEATCNEFGVQAPIICTPYELEEVP